MDRRKTGDVLFYALNCAINDKLSLIDAYSSDESESAVRDAQADIAVFRRLKMNLFGERKTKMETMLEGAKSLTLDEIRKLIDDPVEGEETP